MKEQDFVPGVMRALTKNFGQLREELVKRQDHYEKHAAWERKRAERATQDSSIQQEILRAEAYNRGRADAIREVLSLLGFKSDYEDYAVSKPDFGELLSKAMSERCIDRKELALKAQVSGQAISNYINGKRSPESEIVARIARALNVSCDYLLGVKTE